MQSKAQIDEILRTPATGGDKRSPAHRLVDESVQNSGRDNTTAVVVELAPPLLAT